ncbi:MAG: MerR family transcriptional regulator [Solirubrobacterales bacterium]|nr:MerR family transcriptional regulator [Solirubrobacterales bacterium]MCB8970163.1 MerR family transcriptional regulator [Thermoleophilales bacterium]MCO5326741.1 MerR family transcriptional regulator [Solirubrobacterales bacterium]
MTVAGAEVTSEEVPQTERSRNGGSRPRKALTIGAVCKVLGQEFDDISISKIRYLEDQKLLSPRRTRGGYRLYSQADVEQLRSILRMQRDEFLPLRVIRQELAAGKISGARASRTSSSRKAITLDEPDEWLAHDDVIEQTGATPTLLRELEEFGIVQPQRRDGSAFYDETDVEIVRAATELARFGVQGRNLRVFRSSADREAALLEQIMGPSLSSRSPARRQEAIESLEGLAATCTQLKHLLLVRDLRRLRG